MMVVKDGGGGKLTQMIPRLEDRQIIQSELTQFLAHRTGYTGRGANPALSLKACRRLIDGGQWAFAKGLKIAVVVERGVISGG